MSNLLILANLLPLLLSNQQSSFSKLLSKTSDSEIQMAESNSINGWEEYYLYLGTKENKNNSKGKNNGGSGSVSDSITNVSEYLNNSYSEYYWIKDNNSCGLTSNVSNNIPIEMQSSDFPESDIQRAIQVANVSNYTSYGGCGPIAAMGVLDYFARYLGYNEIISDPTDSDKRIILATEVLTRTHFSIFGGVDNTLVWPWDYKSCFNSVINLHGLSNVISANEQWTLFGGQGNNYWNTVVANIDSGLPVTLFTGLACGDGNFSQHYTNIYGYETWVGYGNNNETITKKFIKARLNWGWDNCFYYCDADILNCGQIGIITYNLNYSHSYSFEANDFDCFVNNDGGGQYFFYNINKSFYLPNGMLLQTQRLRTSYIENQYLVLSPNRANAGTAYLDITFQHHVPYLSFSASLWSGQEGIFGESFKIQYWDSGWINHVEIDLNSLSRLKDYPDDFIVLLPKNTSRIRFIAEHNSPSGNRNKGRICLDNFEVKYN